MGLTNAPRKSTHRTYEKCAAWTLAFGLCYCPGHHSDECSVLRERSDGHDRNEQLFNGQRSGKSHCHSASVSSDLLSFTFSQSVRAVYAGSGFLGNSEADASGDVSLSLSTAAPVRQGYLRLLYEPVVWGLSPGDFSGTLSVAVNGAKTTCGISQYQTCPFPFVPSDAAPAIAFTLGQSFSIDVNQSTRAIAGFIEGSSLNIVNSRVILRILDTDATTPVAVTETPEPTSWMLLGVSLSAAALAFRKRKTL